MNLEWMDDARCREIGGDIFMPDNIIQHRQAIAICNSCPVEQPCLDYALATPGVYGIWGGTSEKQRRRLRRAS